MSARTSASRALWRVVALSVAALAIFACTGEQDPDDGPTHLISGGGTTGVYFSYGRYLAAALSERLDLTVTVTQSNGSVENVRRVASGDALLGFAQGDTALDAVGGRPPFRESLPLAAVARVYDEFVHVVVPEDSTIETIEDLRGQRVSLGAPSSGTEVIAHRVLRAAKVRPSEYSNGGMGIDASIEALRQDKIDAFFWVGGLPTPGVSALAADTPIRLIPLEAYVDQVNQAHGGAYRHAVIPRGVYGIGSAVPTLAVPNYLVTSASAPEDLVYDIVRILFEDRLEIARHVPAAALLDRRRVIFTEPVELHPGAVRYFREAKP